MPLTARYFTLGIGAYFLGWLMSGDIHLPFQFSTSVSPSCKQPLRQPSASQPAPGAVDTPRSGQIWSGFIIPVSTLCAIEARGLAPPSLSSSFSHGLAQRFIQNSSKVFSSIRGSKLGKSTLGACFPEVLQCCSSAGRELFGSSVALERSENRG